MKTIEACNHEWRTVYEASIIAGSMKVAYECRSCNRWVELTGIDPITGIGGRIVQESVLVGINGGNGNCRDGSVYKRQIIHEDGTLEIIRP